MSDAAHAPAHGGGEGVSSKTWKAVGIVLSVMLAAVVIFWIIGMLLNPAADGIQQVVLGFKRVNEVLYGLKYESNLLIINLIQIIVLPFLLYLLIKHWVLK